MPDFGVCVSNPDQCELSCERPALEDLPRRIGAVEQMQKIGSDIQAQVPHLTHFNPFFQAGAFCSKCSGRLALVTQPTEGLPANSDERRRTVKANQLLEAGYRLQALGVLPH
jgi:hypothetical protein